MGKNLFYHVLQVMIFNRLRDFTEITQEHPFLRTFRSHAEYTNHMKDRKDEMGIVPAFEEHVV